MATVGFGRGNANGLARVSGFCPPYATHPNLPVGEESAPIVRRILKDAEVGFAVVDLKETQQKVVSWYVFGPQLQAPLWVTIVNSDASLAQPQAYVQAHHQRIPLLRSMKASSPPKGLLHPITYTAMT